MRPSSRSLVVATRRIVSFLITATNTPAYKTLQKHATEMDVKTAFRMLALRYHPDKGLLRGFSGNSESTCNWYMPSSRVDLDCDGVPRLGLGSGLVGDLPTSRQWVSRDMANDSNDVGGPALVLSLCVRCFGGGFYRLHAQVPSTKAWSPGARR